MSRIRSQINNIKLGNDPKASIAPTSEQMSAGLEQHQETMSAPSEHLERELQRVENSISTLRNDNSLHPQYLDEMEAELQNLKMGIAKISGETTSQVDLNEIAQSIEAGYSEISSKLESYFQSSQETFASQDNFDRLEARIAGVSTTVEELVQITNTQAQNLQSGQAPSADIEPLSAQIELLSQKIDNIPAMSTLGSAMVEEFGGVTQRMDELQSNFNALSAQISTMAPQAGQNDVGQAFEMIESRIGQLAQKIDTLSQTNQSADNDQGAEVLAVLRELTHKVDSIQPSNVNFSEIEAGLASINSQLGNVQAPELNIVPITNRLENIESQIASSRDIVIDMATDAANKSATAEGASIQPAISDPRLDDIGLSLNAITERLVSMENSSAELAQTIENGQRVGLLAEDTDYAPNNSAKEMAVDTSISGKIATSEIASNHDKNLGKPTSGLIEPATQTAYMQSQSVSEPVAPVMEAPTLETPNMDRSKDSGSPEVLDDVPLEPGSGMPDIEALVKRAKERKSGELEGSISPQNGGAHESERNNDLISAARRAAKAAALNAQASTPDEADKNSNAGKKLGGLLKKMKKDPSAKQNAQEALQHAAAATADIPTSTEVPVLDEQTGEVHIENAPQEEKSGKLKQTLMASVAVLALGFAAYTVVPKFFEAKPTQVSSADTSVPATNSAMSETGAQESMEPTTILAPVGSGKLDEVVDKVSPAEETTELSSLPNEVLDPKPTDGAQNNFFEKASTANSSDAIDENASNENTQAPTNEAEQVAAQTDPALTPPAEAGNELLVKAASTGDVNALFEVGRRYSDGDTVARSFVNAAKWYQLAASKGHALSQYRIGNFHEKGHGVKKDLDKAAMWYEQSANKGNALAMHNLAVLKATGAVDSKPDMKQAIDLFTKAANLGVKDSQVNLGILYTQGMGTDKNLEEAYKWFSVASRAGDKDAGKKRDIVANALRPEQLKNARTNAEAWKPAQLDVSANTATVASEWKNTNVKRVSKKDIVRQTQSLLTRAGFDPGPADGLFGLKTQEAILAFQKKHGLS
ncbi:MAG: peptidoglycan-binding protein, partial [Nitratireductor sp.]